MPPRWSRYAGVVGYTTCEDDDILELKFVPIKIISRRDLILYEFYPNSIQQFYARSNAQETVENYDEDSSTLACFRSDNAPFG